MTNIRLVRELTRANLTADKSLIIWEKEPPLTLDQIYEFEQKFRDEEPQRRIGLLFLTKTIPEIQAIAAASAETIEETIFVTLSMAERVEALFEVLQLSARRQTAALAFSKEGKEQTP